MVVGKGIFLKESTDCASSSVDGNQPSAKLFFGLTAEIVKHILNLPSIPALALH